ncbi:hypothetical protein FPV67DRAFT_565248 [Lyophyllum atratum]|nr:hypothetical protein FPV67DRAFT_565248 [Lyophyllum atratum]
MYTLLPTAIVSLFGWLASQASASAVTSSPRNVLTGLLVRQTDPTAGIPAVCKPTCNTVLTNIQGCGTIACMCTTANAGLLKGCVECFLGLAPGDSTIASLGQQIYDNFNTACSGSGVPSLTVFAPDASSTPVPSGSSTRSVVPSITSTPPPITNIFPTTTSPIVQFTVTTMPNAAPQTSATDTTTILPANSARAGDMGVRGMLGVGVVVGLVGAAVGLV